MTFFNRVKETVKDMPKGFESIMIKAHLDRINNAQMDGKKVQPSYKEDILGKAHKFEQECKDKGINKERIAKAAKAVRGTVIATELAVFGSIIWACVSED